MVREREKSALDSLARTSLARTLVVDELITMFYFEYGKNYVFEGELHDFWEFLYVDRGEIEVATDDTRHLLKQGMMIFHKPNEFHQFHATQGKAPNLIVMTFDCHSEAMDGFRDLVIALEDDERNLLAQIVKEGMNAFSFPFEHPLERRADAPIGSEQLIKCYLETLLLRLLRRTSSRETSAPLSSAAKEKASVSLVDLVIEYLEGRLTEGVTLDDVSRTFLIGKTQLKEQFKRATGLSVMNYVAKARVERAKVMIRENTDNMTEIAAKLGFGSVHYFSKSFKKWTRMNPTEYARTVKARLGPEE